MEISNAQKVLFCIPFVGFFVKGNIKLEHWRQVRELQEQINELSTIIRVLKDDDHAINNHSRTSLRAKAIAICQLEIDSISYAYARNVLELACVAAVVATLIFTGILSAPWAIPIGLGVAALIAINCFLNHIDKQFNQSTITMLQKA